MGTAITVTDLHKSFTSEFLRRKHEILKGITLSVEAGEIFGYLGPNGAGKTTTLKCLLGLIFPEKGDIEILGYPHMSLQAKSRLGYLPENPYFYDYLSATEFLRYYSQLHQIPKAEQGARIDGLLERVGLKEAADLQLRKYSKGMLQRVGLAQALLHEPELVLLDEPLGGLDPLGRKEIRDIIVQLKEEGRTVFLSSHILQDIEMICDRVAIIVAGRIVNQGRLFDLISEKILFTEITLSGMPEDELRAFGDCLTTQGGKILLKVFEEAKVQDVLRLAMERKAAVHSLVPRTESLEDLFVGTVKAR
ncbi:MAG: ABC transporter ATP-binding protein [Candidatus Aminicenantaceae bacterium]